MDLDDLRPASGQPVAVEGTALVSAAVSVSHDRFVALVDSFPVVICRFGKPNAAACSVGDATFGYDELHPQTYYGFHYRVRAGCRGLIAAVSLTAANISDVAALPNVVEGTHGFAIGDRNY